jgi:hypothetical protein
MLIGLTGAAGAGKDSVAAILCAAQWRSAAFADALRVEITEAFGIDQRLLTERRHKESSTPQLAAGMASNANWLRWASVNGHSLIQPRSPRWVMQSWGSFRRQHDPQYWVKHVTYWARFQQQYQPMDLVVTDVRYPNEAQALRDLSGHIVRVHRPDTAPLAPETARHDSEHHGAIEASAEIHNDGPLQALHAEVWRVVRQLQGPG